MEIRDTYYRLLNQPAPTYPRYLAGRIDFGRRLTGLIGPRGSGKTTLLLQWIKEKENPEQCMYASLDHIFFSTHRLIDFVRDAFEVEGRTLFMLDEAHKYPGWNQEIKNVYDSFPEVRIVFSGSSSLDLVKGHYDLSRRGVIFRLNGLSLREYILFTTGKAHPAFELENLIERSGEISRTLSAIPRIKGLFQDFLKWGYYPFYFEDPKFYYQRILSTVEKTIYEDIAHFFSLSTAKLPMFKKLLAFLASVPPGEISVNTLARDLGVDHKTVQSYLQMLADTSLIHSLKLGSPGKAALRAPEKVLLENANLYHAIAVESGFEPNLGSLRETFFVNALRGAGIPVQYSKEGDYRAVGKIFEVGGPNKTRKQLKDLSNAILVQDGLLTAAPGEIPLYLFGFLW